MLFFFRKVYKGLAESYDQYISTPQSSFDNCPVRNSSIPRNRVKVKISI